MSSDPKEYKANALRCARLAEEVTDTEVKTTLRQTAQAWLNLAKPPIEGIPKIGGVS